MSDYTNTKAAPQKTGSPNPLAVAVGLIINDASLLPLFVVLLTASVLLEVLGASSASYLRYVAMALDTTGQIAVVSIIVLRWRRRLQSAQGPRVQMLSVIGRIAALSLMTWFILTTPVTGAALSPDPSIAVSFLVLLSLGCVWALRVYFFFAVAGMLGLPLKAAFAKSIQMARGNTGLIIKSLIAPCALTLVASTLFLMPYPDGRSLPWVAAAAASESIFWILSTYIALGYALTMFSDNDWRAAGLSHYRADRLSTLQTQGGKTLPKYLTPRSGFLMLAVGLCFMAGNLIRLGQLPPAAKIEISKVVVKDYSIQVALQVEDREYQFRGLQPQAFFVASKTGNPISNGLVSASKSADSREVVSAVESNKGEPTMLFITFSSTKTGEVLRSLDNMWLWYRAQALLPIPPEKLQQSLK